MKQGCVEVVATVFTNQTKDPSHVIYVVLEKRQEQQKPYLLKSVEMNAKVENSWVLMENVNCVLKDHIEAMAYKQHAR